MFLDKDGQVVASSGCTADSLLRIVDGEYVMSWKLRPETRGVSEQKVCSMGMVVLMSVSISTMAVGFTWIVFQLPGAEVPVSQ